MFFFAWFECPDVQKPRENIRKLTKHKKKQPYVCFCFPRSFFNRVPLGYAGFFFRIFWDFACLPRNAKNMEETKKTIAALCSNGSCSSVLFVFCFLNLFFFFVFFARLPRRTKYSENTKRPNYPKLLWVLYFFAVL